ncbi:MAG: efflux RND transporter permease subunit [Deltaproteobacteria bacterium]|nr:efflux RND transporter permease subunit [Deltaproteobacteria bacterium]
MFLSDVSIKRPVFASMLMAAIVVFGLAAYPSIGLDMLPEVDVPVATIFTIYPGADPETIEKEVSEKIEDAVSTVSGIKTLRSINVENVSQIVIEFELEVDVNQAIQDVRDQVSRAIPNLPSDVEAPIISKFDIGAAPILTLAVSGPGSVDQVTRFARKRVKEPLQAQAGVGAVDVIGGQEREIKVWIDPGKLRAHNLTVNEVAGALAANNLDFPGGRLTSGNTEFSVKVRGRFDQISQIKQMKIMEVMGQSVRIADVARVEDGLEERRTSANLDGERAVTLVVKKQSGTNTVEVGERVKQRIVELQQGFPAGWKVTLVADKTVFIRTSFEHVLFDLIFGAFLAVIIVFLFLRNVRSTMIAAVAIPASVIGTLTFINIMGFTFNTMTLLALSLSIGILIDDAIVVLENIYRHMELGKSPRQAAGFATGEIGLAVLATTLSIVAVFVPVAFMKGMIGRMFYQFGLTVAVAVLISLFVSFTLTPMLCSRYLVTGGNNAFYRFIERILKALDSGCRVIIGWALKHRWSTVGIALLIFVGSLKLAGQIENEMFSPMDTSEIEVTVELPTGTTLVKTEQVATKIAKRVRRHEIVLSTVTSVGSDAQKKQNLASIFVSLTPKTERQMSQFTLIAKLRKELADIKEAEVQVSSVDIVSGGETGMKGNAVQLNLRGGNLSELDRYSRRIAAELKSQPGFTNIDTTYQAGKPEVRVLVDSDRAAHHGVVTAAIGQTINALVGGMEASKFRAGGDDHPIRLRLEEGARRQAEQIRALRVRGAGGQTVELAQMVKVATGTGPTQIDRQDRMRQVTIFAGYEKGMPMGLALKKVQEASAKIVPDKIVTDFGGQAKMMKESFESMFFALILAILIIYMVLASQFESFLHPFTIMIALPLSLPGALGALLISGEAFSIFAMIGVIMLMGLVTKNAILLVDYTNVLRRRDKMERTAALLKAGPTRLRPILMTTGAMVFGMLPIALSNGFGSEMRTPMAVTVIGGLIVSTLLTLVVVPVIYSLVDDLGGLFKRKKIVAPAAQSANS